MKYQYKLQYMPVSERIEYIKKNRIKGDLRTVSDHFALKYNTVRDIINGDTNGPNTEKILKFIEKIISNRLKRQERERKKYALKLQNLQ